MKCWIILVLVVWLGAGRTGAGRDIHVESHLYFAESDSTIPLGVDWPTCGAVLQSPELATSFTSYGTFPADFACYGECLRVGWPCVTFRSPADTGSSYLNHGSILIGGIIGDDTLVSGTLLAAQFSLEFRPPAGRSMSPLRGLPGMGFRSEFYDTNTTVFQHQPMGLGCVLKSYMDSVPGHDRAVVHDLTITNIGNDTIHQAYVGIYFDCDVEYTLLEGYLDDIAGSIRDRGIGYIIDNDGDPSGSIFKPESPRRIFAAKFLKTSFDPVDTNFNWWVQEPPAGLDFGPRRKDVPYRDFGTGSTGRPEGDQNLYYVLSNPEWDYDQVFAQHIDSSDPVWRTPPSRIAADVSDGNDTRFILSTGPFTLLPGASERVLFTTFTGSDVHHDAYAFRDFLTALPEIFVQQLNMRDLYRTADSAVVLADRVTDPLNAITGIRPVSSRGDSIALRWDPQVFDGVTAHQVLLQHIDKAPFPYPNVPPPWLQPESLRVVAVSDATNQFTLAGLDSTEFYFVTVVPQVGPAIGDTADAAVIGSGYRPAVPQVNQRQVFFASPDPVTITWGEDNGSHRQSVRVYRFSSRRAANNIYKPFYDHGSFASSVPPRDSFVVDGEQYYYYQMEPYAVVEPGVEQFTDTATLDSAWYRVSIRDTNGFESDLSPVIEAFDVERFAHDILVLTKSAVVGTMAEPDSIQQFYTNVLAGCDYTILPVVDSPLVSSVKSWWPTMARYRAVIIDDIMRDLFLGAVAAEDLATYINAGGTLVYCGSMYGKTFGSWSGMVPGFYDLDSSTAALFGVDSVYQMPVTYFRDSTALPYQDTCFGFVRADGSAQGVPNASYDHDRVVFREILATYWPSHSAPLVSAFKPAATVDVVQTYEALSPGQSRLHGYPVGIKRNHTYGTTYAFGYHLWYMDIAEARVLLDWIMERVPTDAPNEPAVALPVRMSLSQNFPNPFNPSTTIAFELPQLSHVKLDIFNILGQRVATLLDEARPAGAYQETWNGCDDHGARVSSGIYFYRLSTSERRESRKMILLK